MVGLTTGRAFVAVHLASIIDVDKIYSGHESIEVATWWEISNKMHRLDM